MRLAEQRGMQSLPAAIENEESFLRHEPVVID